jgi:EmrB/QacA subfamily drug resistance transporter
MRPDTHTRRSPVLAALVLANFMVAIEATIVATAMPSIVAKLGGLAIYSWVFSGFLLMQAVTIPVYGKLADLFGRKRVFIAGSVLFLAGSALCALAWSMSALVAFRFVQGAGAGCVQPLAMTLVGDLYALEERGRVQGYMASVWGVSAIVGPLVGALIVQNAHWSWIFWLNIPFGVVSLALIGGNLHEPVQTKRASIDYAGALLIFGALFASMLAMTQAGHWAYQPVIALFALGGISLWFFLRQERRAADPIMHLELWERKSMVLANVSTLSAGIAMIGVITFLPIFVQGVLGESALVAGIALCTMSVGWPLASVITGHLLTRVGMRRLSRFGGCAVLAGGLILALAVEEGPIVAGAGSFVMGAGLGMLSSTIIVFIQSSVSWSQRGVATATNILMRILGNTLGAALFGGVLNLALRHEFVLHHGSGLASAENLQDIFSAGARGAVISEALAAAVASLSSGLHAVFWAVIPFAAVTLATAWFIPDLGKHAPEAA